MSAAELVDEGLARRKMSVVDRELLELMLERDQLAFGEDERDECVGVIVGQVCDLQDSLVEYWRGQLTPGEDDELPF